MAAKFKRAKTNVGGPAIFGAGGSRMPLGPHMQNGRVAMMANIGGRPLPGWGGGAWSSPANVGACSNVGGYAAPFPVSPWGTRLNAGAIATANQGTRATTWLRANAPSGQAKPRCFNRSTGRIEGGVGTDGYAPPAWQFSEAPDGTGIMLQVPEGQPLFIPYCGGSSVPGRNPGTPPGPSFPTHHPSGGGGGGGAGGGGGGGTPPGYPTTPTPGKGNGNVNDYYWPGNPLGCTPVPAPQLQMGPDGCAQGWLQCKQPLPVTSLAVAAGATAPITVTPRRVATPIEFIYTGTLGDFQIDSVEIDGTDYFDGAVHADVYQPAMTDLRVAWGQFSSTTPLIMTVTSLAAGAADFRGTIMSVVARG